VDVVQVRLLVSVTDSKGRLITGLKKEDFKVYEDGRLQTIDALSSETDIPLSIALLVDSSSSVIDKLDFEKAAAREFFLNTVKPRKDRAMVVAFNSEVREVAGFTDQQETLARGVEQIRAQGTTALYDAVYSSVRGRLSKEAPDRRKLIVLISDGDDTDSKYSLAEAVEAAQRNDVTVYAISTNRTAETKRADRERGEAAIRELVEETGGKSYAPLKLEELTGEFQKIEEELRSQYVVFYTSSNRALDGSYRQLRVEMTDSKYKARTREGYFAPGGK
jgi:VWFA-related protein